MPPKEPIKPSLRKDLIVTQAQLEGEIAYTVRDDATGESFRMYAVEYAIAQRLNGERDLTSIIAAVQSDLQLQVTMPQLLDFLRELDGRGLIEGFVEPESNAVGAPPVPEAAESRTQETATLMVGVPPRAIASVPTAPVPMLLDDASTVASPGDAVAAGAFALVTQELVLQERGSLALAKAGLDREVPVDPHEVQKMLRDALHRMVDDDVGGAANILNAARALAPGDERVNALVEATQTAYARGTKEATSALKAQSASLFPELMPKAPEGATTRPEAAAAPPKVRPLFKAAAWVGVLAVTATGLWAGYGQLLGRPVGVRVQSVAFAPHEQRLSPARAVRGAPLAALGFGVGGLVAKLPTPGAHVVAQEVLGSLKLPPALRQNMLVSAQKVRQAELTILRLQRHREELIGQRRLLVARAQTDKRRGAAALFKRNMRLIEREERQVRAALLAAQNRRAQANQAQTARNDSARGLQLIAPRAGVVEAVLAQVGQQVEAGAPVVRLSDSERLTLTFEAEPTAQLPAPKAQVRLIVAGPKGGKRTLEGTVQPVAAASTGTADGIKVAVQGLDLPLGPEAWALWLSSNPKALLVPKKALVGPEGGLKEGSQPWVWLLQEGRLKKLPVAVLDSEGEGVWVAPKEPQGGVHVPLVVEAQGTPLATLRDGAQAAAR